MNKELYGREFLLPDNIIQHIKTAISTYGNIDGFNRANNLLNTGKVNYNQLKRILHDMKYMDKVNQQGTYNLYGGELLEKWGTALLYGERQQIKNRKQSYKRSEEISGIGARNNAYLKSHSRNDLTTAPNTDFLKTNSEKNSVSSLKLNEEINKIKRLM